MAISIVLSLASTVGAQPASKLGKCGSGILEDIRVRDDEARNHFEHRPQTAAIYTAVIRFDHVRYTAESNGGRIALFGPLVANSTIDVCIRKPALILTHPRDIDPEVTTYEMKIVKSVRDRSR